MRSMWSLIRAGVRLQRPAARKEATIRKRPVVSSTDESVMESAPSRDQRRSKRAQRLHHLALQHDAFLPPPLPLAPRALGRDADLLHSRLPRRGLDLAHVLRHLALEFAARQHHVRIDRPEEESVIAHLAL